MRACLGQTVVVALVALATLSPSASRAATHASTLAEKRAIEHTILVLFDALEHHDYHVACQQYAPKDRALLVLVARQTLHQPSTANCARAIALIAAKNPNALGGLTRPRFGRIIVSGKHATATTTVIRPTGTQTSKIPLILEPGGWKVEFAVSASLHP